MHIHMSLSCHFTCPNASAVVALTDAWRTETNDGLGDDYDRHANGINPFGTESPMAGRVNVSNASWYRFAGAAGTRMMSEPPDPAVSGTFACAYHDGWLFTQHPGAGEPSTDATVCFTVRMT